MADEYENSGPRLSGAVVAGFLTFLLGVFLGTASLVSQPISVHTKAPDPESIEPGKAIFVRGDRTGRTAWRAKEQAWKAGQVDRLMLSESELNQWSEERLELQAAGDAEAAEGWGAKLEVEAEPVNFRLADGRIQLATQLRMPGLFPNTSFQYVIQGRLTAEGNDGIRFIPEAGTLGQAPLGSVPGIRDWLYTFVLSQFNEAENLDWLAESLAAIRAVEVNEGGLVLERNGRS